jgi:hypothetical protein
VLPWNSLDVTLTSVSSGFVPILPPPPLPDDLLHPQFSPVPHFVAPVSLAKSLPLCVPLDWNVEEYFVTCCVDRTRSSPVIYAAKEYVETPPLNSGVGGGGEEGGVVRKAECNSTVRFMIKYVQHSKFSQNLKCF